MAELLGVRPGSTVLAVEQTATDPAGRVFDAAVLRMRPIDARSGDPCPRDDSRHDGHRAAG